MWSLIKTLPWRGMLLMVVISALLAGLYAMGYSSGHDAAKRDGDAALSRLQSAFDTYKTKQTTLENAALRAWAKRYQEQVVAGHQAGASYLEQIAQLESQNRQLQGQINDVTQRWIDEQGKSHPVKCVFTRGFVQQYNAALGAAEPPGNGRTGGTSATSSGAGTATGNADTALSRLRDSGVSQADVLANVTDNARQCRIWREQVNGLLNYIEG